MLQLDAESLYAELRDGVRSLLGDDGVLVGIWSGGAWLAERLQRDLRRPGAHGVISSTLHRDDYASRGLGGSDPTSLPFAVDGARIVLVDDVLYTGRSVRAAINELFDFGRPASIELAVLVDRGGRELPVEPTYCGARLAVVLQEGGKLIGQCAMFNWNPTFRSSEVGYCLDDAFWGQGLAHLVGMREQPPYHTREPIEGLLRQAVAITVPPQQLHGPL